MWPCIWKRNQGSAEAITWKVVTISCKVLPLQLKWPVDTLNWQLLHYGYVQHIVFEVFKDLVHVPRIWYRTLKFANQRSELQNQEKQRKIQQRQVLYTIINSCYQGSLMFQALVIDALISFFLSENQSRVRTLYNLIRWSFKELDRSVCYFYLQIRKTSREKHYALR